jgi:hypothetical protein
LYNRAKACIYAKWAYFELKMARVFDF